VASASGVAVVIPPRIGFVIYGSIANISIGKIFIAGIIPGMVIGLGYAVYTLIVAHKKGWKGAKRGSLKEIWVSFKDAIWGLMTPVIILGGIYGGVFTPTEAAAVAVAYGLFVGLFIYKEIHFRDLFLIIGKAGVSSAGVLFIIANASVLTWLITTQQIAAFFTTLLLDISSNAVTAMLLMGLIVFIAGFFIDGASIFYLFLPVFLPVLRTFKMDLVWFGVFMQTAIAIGFITPPVAVNLYPACLIGGISLEAITRPIISFVFVAVITLLIIGFFPGISTWLPSVLGI
jgi:C4-dicarboxylate transporter DctM subunit